MKLRWAAARTALWADGFYQELTVLAEPLVAIARPDW
jgi:hypothetical protein